MSDNDYLRVISGQLHALLAFQFAREKFGKGYLELTAAQVKEVEDLVASAIEHYAEYYSSEHIMKVLGPYPLSKLQ